MSQREKQLNVMLNEEEYSRLKELADDQEVTLASVIRQAIRYHWVRLQHKKATFKDTAPDPDNYMTL